MSSQMLTSAAAPISDCSPSLCDISGYNLSSVTLTSATTGSGIDKSIKLRWKPPTRRRKSPSFDDHLEIKQKCVLRREEGLERLIYNRISPVIPVIDPQLPQEQAGFRPGRSTLDQVAKLTSDIELAFDGNLKGGAVFVDLTAAYDTVWRRGLILKLLRMLPNRHMVHALHFRAHLKSQRCR